MYCMRNAFVIASQLLCQNLNELDHLRRFFNVSVDTKSPHDIDILVEIIVEGVIVIEPLKNSSIQIFDEDFQITWMSLCNESDELCQLREIESPDIISINSHGNQDV